MDEELENYLYKLQVLKSLYKAQNYALEYCHENSLDYYCIVQLNNLLQQEFLNIIDDFDQYTITQWQKNLSR